LTTSPRGTFGAFLAFWSQGCSARQEKENIMKLMNLFRKILKIINTNDF
jgi:hypothetical protein